MVTDTVVLWLMPPPVACTVTVPLRGVGGVTVPEPLLLPPPQETTGSSATTTTSPPRTFRNACLLPLRRRGGFRVNTTPKANARLPYIPPPPGKKCSGAPRSRASVAAFMVRVAVPLPPLTVVGDTEQVVAPREDDTEHVRLTSDEKPDTDATVSVSVPEPPLARESELLAADNVKSGVPTFSAMGTVWEVVPFVACTVSVPAAAFAPAVITVSVEVTAVAPFAATEGAEHVVAVSELDGVQVKLIAEPAVPSTLNVKVAVSVAATRQ